MTREDNRARVETARARLKCKKSNLNERKKGEEGERERDGRKRNDFESAKAPVRGLGAVVKRPPRALINNGNYRLIVLGG